MITEEQADEIRRLVKKWLETGDDNALHELQDITQNAANIIVPKSRILERYLDATLDVHLHFLNVEIGAVGMVANAHEWCAVAHHVVDSSMPCNRAGNLNVGMAGLDKHIVSDGVSERQCPMLVDVYEMIKLELSVELQHVPSVVRLQLLDQCKGLRQDAVESVPPLLVGKRGAGATDRELAQVSIPRKVGRRVGVDLDKLPNEMIEGGSHVMQAISDNNAELQGGLRELGEKLDGSRISVLLSNETALFLVPFNLLSYRVEMMLSPDDFKPYSV